LNREKVEFPSITPETIKEKDPLLDFVPLAEITVRRELKSLPVHFADFRELVNIGLIKIDALIRESFEKNKNFNSSYIRQAIVWEIKNKNRENSYQRGEKRSISSVKDESEHSFSIYQVREAVIEAVVSFDGGNFEIEDKTGLSPERSLEIRELKKLLTESIALLPEKNRQVIKMKFIQNLKGIEIAKRLGISSTRVTRLIQDGLDRIRKRLESKKFSLGIFLVILILAQFF